MPDTIGQRLKQARWEKDWTQKTLAIKSGVPKNTISVYERDLAVPTLLAAADLADTLGVSLDWLAGRSEEGGVSK